MNVAILLLGLLGATAAAVLIVVGRRRRLDRAATTGEARTSTLEILGIGLAVAALASISRAF